MLPPSLSSITEPPDDPPWARVVKAIRQGLDPDPLDIEDALALGESPPSEYLDWKSVQDAWGIVLLALHVNRTPHPEDIQFAQESGVEAPQEFIDWQQHAPGPRRGGHPYWREKDDMSYARSIAACRLVDRMRDVPEIGRRLSHRSRIGLKKAFEIIQPLSLVQLRELRRVSDEQLTEYLCSPDHIQKVFKEDDLGRRFYAAAWRPTKEVVEFLRHRTDELVSEGLDKRAAFRRISTEGVFPRQTTRKLHLPAGLLWRIYSRGLGLASVI